MSDIRLYTAAQASSLVPLTGDVILCTEAFNSAPANSVHLCTNATGPVWKSFQNDGEATPFLNAWGADFGTSSNAYYLVNTSATTPWTGIKALTFYTKIVAAANGSVVSGFNRNTTSTAGYGRVGQNSQSWTWNDGTKGGSSAAIITYGQWYQVTMNYVSSGYTDANGSATVSGTGWEFYVDGTRVYMNDDLNYNYLPLYITSKFTLGAEGERKNYLHYGQADEIALWTESLTSSDLNAIFAGPANMLDIDPSNLHAYYRLGDSDTSPSSGGKITSTQDLSGNGLHMTQADAANQPSYYDLTGESIYA
jgi:hypothetical protein